MRNELLEAGAEESWLAFAFFDQLSLAQFLEYVLQGAGNHLSLGDPLDQALFIGVEVRQGNRKWTVASW